MWWCVHCVNATEIAVREDMERLGIGSGLGLDLELGIGLGSHGRDCRSIRP